MGIKECTCHEEHGVIKIKTKPKKRISSCPWNKQKFHKTKEKTDYLDLNEITNFYSAKDNF